MPSSITFSTVIGLLALGFLPAVALADGDPIAEPFPLNSEGNQSEADRPLKTWASDHRSFPQVDSEISSDLICFMQTEDGRTLDLEKICGNSGEASLTQPEQPN